MLWKRINAIFAHLNAGLIEPKRSAGAEQGKRLLLQGRPLIILKSHVSAAKMAQGRSFSRGVPLDAFFAKMRI